MNPVGQVYAGVGSDSSTSILLNLLKSICDMLGTIDKCSESFVELMSHCPGEGGFAYVQGRDPHPTTPAVLFRGPSAVERHF